MLPLLALAALTLAQAARPDIVVIVIDDVADSDVDDLQGRGWLPNISALAERGVRYRRAYAHAKCAPTRDSLLYASVVGLDRGDSCAPPGELAASSRSLSLAEMLDGAGYATLHVGKWHVGPPEFGPWEMGPHLSGFDSVRNGVPVGPECNVTGVGQPRLDDGEYAEFVGDNTIACRDALIQWWLETPTPRFVMVNFGAAHAPFKYPDPSLLPQNFPPCGLVNCTNRREYEAEIVGADTAVGQIVATVGNDAYYVFMGDNGTPGLVPGQSPTVTVATRPDQDPAKVKLSCYEDGVRVPLIVAGPGIAARETDALVHAGDVMPTLARVAGIQPLPDALVIGQPFAGTLVGGAGKRQDLYVHDPATPASAMIEHRWKLLTRADGVEELYDLEADPAELTPLPAEGPDAERLRARRAAILAGGR